MIVATILFILGLVLSVNGVRFFRTAIPLISFLLGAYFLYQYLSGLVENPAIFSQLIFITVAIIASSVIAIFARGLFSIALFWFAIIVMQALVASLVPDGTISQITAVAISIFLTIFMLYMIFFSRFSYLFGIVFSSFVGASLVLVSLNIFSGNSNFLSENFANNQSNGTILFSFIILVIGISVQIFVHSYTRTPKASHRQWGLESFDI